LKWFTTYLTNRRQCTVLQNHESELECVTYGVPQVSVLEPLLFLIYVNDIQYAITNAKSKLFADDTNLFLQQKFSKAFNFGYAGMLQLSDWFQVNELSLNVDKPVIVYLVLTVRKIRHLLCILMEKLFKT